MKPKVLLCVDLSYQVYRASAAHPMLSCDQVFTGGLYGFLVTLAKTIRETGATHIAFCQDRKPYLRSRVYPEYKQIRKKTADDDLLQRHKESMVLVLSFLRAFNFPVWGVDGFESDDIIGHCVAKYRHRFDRIIAASNDSDIFQWLWVPNFAMYTKDINNLMTEHRLWQALQVTAKEHPLMCALTGTHNDIAGIQGVGPKTALKAIRDPAVMRTFRADYGAMIDRNLALIKLPHPEFPRIASIPAYTGGFNQRELIRWLDRYDIDTTQSMVNAFEQLEPT